MKLYIGRDRIYSSHWAFAPRSRFRHALRRILLGALIVLMVGIGGFSVWLIVTDADALRLTLIVVGLLAVGAMAKGMKH